MSLLLDALRRAAAAKDGPAGDRYTVPRRGDGGPEPARSPPAAGAPDRRDDRPEVPPGDAGALALEPRADTGEPARAEGEPAPGAAAAGTPAGDGNATAAQAVLHGGGRGRGGGRVRSALALGAGMLLLAAIFAGGAWYYYGLVRTDVTRELASFRPQPAPARAPADAEAGAGAGDDDGVAVQAPARDAAAPVGVPRPGAGVAEAPATAASGGAPAGAEAEGERAASVRPAAGGDVAPEADADAVADAARAADDAPAVPADENQTTATKAAAGDAADEGEATPAQAAAGDETRVATATTERTSAQARQPRRARPLVRASAGQPLMEALQDGYEALQAGDLDAAAGAYRRARRIAPDNRDALLGAAAVAQRRGNAAEARTLYQRILGDHPRDPYARAGLASLDGALDPRRSESELKMLLRERPDAASLHFTLGNIYAAESRWAEAQEAYFEAVRAAPGDAAYAYNLAVALDHLGQRAAARRYYEQAVALADGRATGVPVAAVERRLRQLR